jgi:hypothetical protein
MRRNMPAELKSARALVRFGLRMIILSVFATLAGAGFARSFVALSWMSAMFCIIVGTVKREAIFDSFLTHWDEAAAYGALCCLCTVVSQAAAS